MVLASITRPCRNEVYRTLCILSGSVYIFVSSKLSELNPTDGHYRPRTKYEGRLCLTRVCVSVHTCGEGGGGGELRVPLGQVWMVGGTPRSGLDGWGYKGAPSPGQVWMVGGTPWPGLDGVRGGGGVTRGAPLERSGWLGGTPPCQDWMRYPPH